MVRAWTVALPVALPVVALALTGCGDGEKVKPVDVEIKIALSPLDQAIAFLDRYAKGDPLGSEASQFDDIVKAVGEKDARTGDILRKGFADLQKASPAQMKTKAAALIRQVSPNNSPPPP